MFETRQIRAGGASAGRSRRLSRVRFATNPGLSCVVRLLLFRRPTPTHSRRSPLLVHQPGDLPMTVTIQDTAFARLEAEGRLVNSVLKAPTHKAGRFGFRGDLALKFPAKLADEARPPEISCEQVIAAAQAGEPRLAFFCGFLLSFEYLKLVAEVLGETLSPDGQYFLYCDNIDLSKRYQVDYGGATFFVLPIDEATVYNEMLELLYLEKTELKRLDTAGKTDAIADRAAAFKQSFPKISYEEGLALMGPVRNPYENRPV
jgi:hypothetical protein